MKLARKLMDENGLQYASLKEIKTRTALGRCHQSFAGTFTEIRLSSLSLPICSDEEILNTITHEMAHAIVGVHHGHDNVWRRKHIELGGNGERTFHSDKKHNEARIQMFKYIGVCPNGHIHPVQRLPKRLQSCGTCSRKFDSRYLIEYKLNDGSYTPKSDESYLNKMKEEILAGISAIKSRIKTPAEAGVGKTLNILKTKDENLWRELMNEYKQALNY
jgi:predicted SprT family Zn-dependent metalloprotease